MISAASMKKVTSATAKMAVKHDWVAAAMTDDQMVAELLIRLKHAGTVVSENPGANLPPLQWGIRQRRSRSSRFGGGGVLVSLKKDVDSVRASPKTPLSWSGGSGSGGGGGSASPSTATADGIEDISRQASCSTSTGSGSKVPSLSLISLSPKTLRLDSVFSSSPFLSIANSAAMERCKNPSSRWIFRSDLDFPVRRVFVVQKILLFISDIISIFRKFS